MRRPRRRAREAPVFAPADLLRVEALTVAMTLAPGVYVRNRMFDLFSSPVVQRAKSRAATLRGIVEHLRRAGQVMLDRVELPLDATCEGGAILRYQISVVSLSRVVELSRVELATLRVLAANAGETALPLEATDRALVETALTRLLGAGGDAGTLARAAHDRATPSTPPPAG